MIRPRGRSRKTWHTVARHKLDHSTFPWLEGGFGVALGWLWVPNWLPISWLSGGFEMAWGGFPLAYIYPTFRDIS